MRRYTRNTANCRCVSCLRSPPVTDLCKILRINEAYPRGLPCEQPLPPSCNSDYCGYMRVYTKNKKWKNQNPKRKNGYFDNRFDR
ncbi:hypothetical protein YPO0307 [Yersinia pestis CO92]|uniref:Uncharacterized protein n=1 Tax=Yersinia pestis TaxID=632 RepID=Q74XG1_YERPE|nr:hypothetical protein YPE_2960 [Yersinia pestis CA88-4125]KPD72246.1 hypothetical protein ADT35_09230 [Yersinia pestis subsp. microtus bv. Talassica]KPD77319.1 hypothetical protein ADT36_09775 [Yersinia pestis subsp. microtus bv. Caucasica]PVU26013.1 hypothetical protein A8M58_21155 [Yersinia pestis]CAL18992.1 hypothetical protein YPO0307 [Yersinia pestis CO92]